MKTLKEVLNKSIAFLETKGILNPRLQAEEILSCALGSKRLDLYMQFDRPLTEEEVRMCREYLRRRGQGEPVQYIRGDVNFMGCHIQVDQRALIPRQETEILVEKVMKSLENDELEGKALWDVCTGSGCIGIALKKRFPKLKVTVSDVSTEALALAKENGNMNNVEISYLPGNLLEPFSGKKADYVVCNPPYIPAKDFDHLDREVKDYEPTLALVADQNGLGFYQRLSKLLPHYLNARAKIWFEIGHNQGESIDDLFNDSYWVSKCIEKDWAGHDRYFFLQMGEK